VLYGQYTKRLEVLKQYRQHYEQTSQCIGLYCSALLVHAGVCRQTGKPMQPMIKSILTCGQMRQTSEAGMSAQ
jgi:hypothetical protein